MLQQMQMCMNKVIQKWCFLRCCHDFGGPRASWRQPRRRNRNCSQKVKPGVSFSGGYFGSFLLPKKDWGDSIGVCFYVPFCHRSGKPPATISKDFGVMSKSILGSFGLRFGRCCKTQKMQPFQTKYLVWQVLGLRFCFRFLNFLNVFFVSLSRRTVCSILADLGLRKESMLGPILKVFVDFA